ncbi:MAG: methionine--tRNA ligase [Vicinamibacterales bacterium]
MSRFYLTTAIDYVNSRPHLGHALEKIGADVIARYHRLIGDETRLVIGNDEHSQNVFRRAREQGLDPLVYCDQMETAFRDVWRRLGISYDDFIRTTEPRHRAAVQKLVERCHAAGDVYEGFYEGWYCVGCEAFKQEKDLVDGRCPIHLTKPEWIREKNYFFRLSAYRDRLLRHYDDHPRFVQPEIRRNELLRLLESGLDDISISRAGQNWGIPVPFDPASVVYVWFDALINYASAVGYGTDEVVFERWWPANLHVVGKDITRFHAVVWPAMLMSAGLALPEQVFGHGWVHFKGQRMSKTLGTVVDPLEAADRLGPDPLRLFLVKEIAFGGDGDFSWDRFEERYNADLANNLGNLVSRVTTMIDRYGGGVARAPVVASSTLADRALEAVSGAADAMSSLALERAAQRAFDLVDQTNEYLADEAPWTLARDPSRHDRVAQVLAEAAEAVRIAGVLLLPIMPASAAEILRRVGETRAPETLRLPQDTGWRPDVERRVLKGDAMWPRLDTGSDTSSPEPPTTPREIRVTDNVEPLATPATVPPAAPVASTPAAVAQERIAIDDFMKVELRVAKVLTAERVPKSKKLLKLSVDVGTEHRTLVAGIAEAYEPEALVGRTVVVVFNLKPATLMGIESNGMVLAASPEGGKPELVGFSTPPPPGSRVR